MKLALTEIFIDHSINIRDGLDENTIETYCHTFDQLPPVVVFKLPAIPNTIGKFYGGVSADQSRTNLPPTATPAERIQDMYLLADGFHRMAAARKLGEKEIEADVREGTRAEAEEFAILANLKHGKPLTRSERKRAVEAMLILHPERANKWIADDMGVDSKTVKTYRENLESRSEIPIVNGFIRRDGEKAPRELQNKPSQEEKEQSEENRRSEIPIVNEPDNTDKVVETTSEIPISEEKEQPEENRRSEIPIVNEPDNTDKVVETTDWEEFKEKMIWIKDYIYELGKNDEIYNLGNSEVHEDLTNLLQAEKLMNHQLGIIHDILDEAGEVY